MDIRIELNKNPSILAELNKTVQDIHFNAYPYIFKPYDYESILVFMKETLAKDNWYSFVAFSDDKPVAYALFWIRNYKENPFRKSYRAIHIDQICVNTEFQNISIGSSLMKSIEDFAYKNKIHQLELNFWEDNIHAKNFYDKYGFKKMTHFISIDI